MIPLAFFINETYIPSYSDGLNKRDATPYVLSKPLYKNVSLTETGIPNNSYLKIISGSKEIS